MIPIKFSKNVGVMMFERQNVLVFLAIIMTMSLASALAANEKLDKKLDYKLGQETFIRLIGSATDTFTPPPPTDTSPPPTDTSPPPTDTSPPPTDTSPPPTDTSPPPTDTSPPPTDTSPPPTDTSPPPTDTSPPPTDTSPPPTDTSPPPTDTSPPPTDTSPPPTDTSPPPTDTSPPPTDTSPPPTDTSPPPTDTSPPPTDTSPPPSANPTSTPSSGHSGGGSSSGGGGGFISGEDFSNIEVIEKYDNIIYKDITTSYRFVNVNNPIRYVNITGNTNADIITSSIEVLKSKSKLVAAPQSGIVYKNINIWVGLNGYAVPKNIKYAIIKFRIANSWINDNNLSSGDIKLQRWDGSNWIILETFERSSDDEFTYFEANTNSFSPFIITGMKRDSSLLEVLLTPQTMEKAVKNPSKKTPKDTSEDKSSFLMDWFLISGIFVVIGLIIEVYVTKKRKIVKT